MSIWKPVINNRKEVLSRGCRHAPFARVRLRRSAATVTRSTIARGRANPVGRNIIYGWVHAWTKQLVACTPCRTACLDTTRPARSPVHSPNIPDAKLRYEVGGAALTAGCSPAVAPRVNSYLVGRRGGEKKSQNPRARSDDRVLRSPQPAGSATFPEMRHAGRTIAYTITCCPLGGAAPRRADLT